MRSKTIKVACGVGLVVIMLALAALACMGGGGSGRWAATATYGAVMYHAQLTEVEKP